LIAVWVALVILIVIGLTFVWAFTGSYDDDRAVRVWTGVLGTATVIAALIGLFTLWAISGQLDEMRQERRAWLAPGALEVPDNFEKGVNEYTEVSFRYENVGKEPAMKVNFVPVWDVVSLEEYRNSDKTLAHIEKLMKGVDCKQLSWNENGMTVFPEQKPGFRMGFEKSLVEKINAKNNQYAFVAGCLVYETLGDRH
jgi:nitrogen fixation-related uncharacterized protein